MSKRTIGVTIFGVIFIIGGLYSILFPLTIYGKYKTVFLMLNLSFVKYSPFILSLAFLFLIGGIFSIIIGIGLFRLRYWVWYLIIANQIIKIIGLSNKVFILGWQAYVPAQLVAQIGTIVFILWFFMRPKIRGQFFITEEKFKLKSWYAISIILLLFMTLAIPVTVIGYKFFNSVKSKQPFLVKKPQLIRLGRKNNSFLENRFKVREIFNFSFLAPADFVLRGFDNKTAILALGRQNRDNGFIMVENKPGLDITRGVYKVMQFKNTYQFEEALYSNNWGIILLILREISLPHYGDNTQIRRFDTPAAKGFIKYGYRKDKDQWVYDCSIYDKLNNGLGNILLILKGKDFSPDEMLTRISLIGISKVRKPEEYYQKGIRLLDEGNYQNAQFAFANAYYYMPKKAEYGYMLAKTLSIDDKFSLNAARRILEDVLQLEPDYIEAKELLESIQK